jgi:hypothetical protein
MMLTMMVVFAPHLIVFPICRNGRYSNKKPRRVSLASKEMFGVFGLFEVLRGGQPSAFSRQ